MDFKNKYLKKQRDTSAISSEPPFPKILKIDTCNICNYNCVFCPQSKQIGKKGVIDRELCLKIVKDAYVAGARELCLSMTGEPLISSDIEEYIKYAKTLGYSYVFLNTNGYLCDEKRGKNLLDAGLDSIKFSVNADEKWYSVIHGVDGFYRVVDNIKNLFEYRNKTKSPCKIYISYVAVKQTIEDSENLKKRLGCYCDDMIVINANNRGGSISELDKGLFLPDDEYAFRYPCSQLFNNAYVTSEGYMIICCQDFENMTVVANLNEESIVQAWNNEQFVTFRKKYLNKDLEGTLCYNCLNNCNKRVTPFIEKYAGYSESAEKKKNLEDRVQLLLNTFEGC